MHSRENFFELVDLQNNNSNNVQYQDQSLLTQVFKSILQHTISAFVKVSNQVSQLQQWMQKICQHKLHMKATTSLHSLINSAMCTEFFSFLFVFLWTRKKKVNKMFICEISIIILICPELGLAEVVQRKIVFKHLIDGWSDRKVYKKHVWKYAKDFMINNILISVKQYRFSCN